MITAIQYGICFLFQKKKRSEKLFLFYLLQYCQTIFQLGAKGNERKKEIFSPCYRYVDIKFSEKKYVLFEAQETRKNRDICGD